ncbi:hypothetical protein [Nitrosomonas communis]|nr:hypothetical protein [Nitrosomonas communis]
MAQRAGNARFTEQELATSGRRAAPDKSGKPRKATELKPSNLFLT